MSGKNPTGLGKEPQSYEGINIIVPLGGWQLVRAKRDPTTNDKKYPVGALWVNTTSENVWIQVQPSGVWLQLANSSGDLLITSPLTTNGVIYATGVNGATSTAAGTSGQLLQSAGSSSPPAYTTATYPTTTTGHDLLYSSADNTVANLASANNGTLVTSSSGVPSILAGPGTTGNILQSNAAAAPSFSSSTYPSSTVANELLYASATNVVGQVTTANGATLITSQAGVPSFVALNDGQTIVGQGPSSSPTGTYFTNSRITYAPSFNSIPVMSASTGGVAAVTQGTTNVWAFPQWGAYFECFNNVATSIIAPTLSATAGSGLNIGSLTGANAKIIELTEGNSTNTKNAFTTGTSASFYVQVGLIVPTLNTVQNLYVGFRAVQTYQATSLVTYTDYALIGLLSTAGEIEIATQKATGGQTTTDTTQAATAATLFTLRVNVSGSGVVTYAINGSPPSTTAAYTFTASTNVIPMIYLAEASGAHGECDLVSYQCGFA